MILFHTKIITQTIVLDDFIPEKDNDKVSKNFFYKRISWPRHIIPQGFSFIYKNTFRTFANS